MAEQHDINSQQGLEPNRTSGLRMWLNRIAVSIFVFMIIVAVSVAALFVIVERRGGIEQLVGDEFSDILPGVETRISDLSFSFDVQKMRLIVRGRETELSYQSQHASLETIDLIFGPSSLYKLFPEEVVVQARAISLKSQDSGWQFSDDFSWLNPISGLHKFAQPDDADQHSSVAHILWPNALDRLTIKANELTVLSSESSKRTYVRFTDFSLSLWPEDTNRLNAVVRASQPVEAGQITPQMNLSVQINLVSALTTFELDAKYVDFTRILTLAGWPGLLANQEMKDVDVKLSGTFDGDALLGLSGRFTSAHGSVAIDQRTDLFTANYSDMSLHFDYSAVDQLAIIHEFSAQLPRRQSFNLTGKLTQVHSEQVGLSLKVLGEGIFIPDLLNHWPQTQAANLRTMARRNLAGGRFKTLAVQFEGELERRQDGASLSVSLLDLSGEYANVRLSHRSEQYETVVGTLNGSIDAKIGPGGQLRSATTTLSMHDGFLRLANYGPTVRIPAVELELKQEGKQTLVQNLFVDLATKGRFTVSADRNQAASGFVSELELQADYFDIELFKHIWPKQLAPMTRTWMHRRVSDGNFGKTHLNFAFLEQDSPPILTAVSGDAVFDQASFHLYEDMIPATRLSGRLKFEDNHMTAYIEEGVIDKLSVAQAQIAYGPLMPVTKDKTIKLNLNAEGDIDTVLHILGHNKINQLEPLGLIDKTLSGSAEFDLDMSIAESRNLSVTGLTVNGSMSDAAIGNLPLNHALTKSSLVLTYQQGNAQISGSGLLSSVPTDFVYKTNADDTISLSLKTANDAAVTGYLKDRYALPVDGAMGLKIAVSGQPEQASFKVGIMADAKDTSVSFPAFDWAKLPGEEATVDMQMIFEDGQLRQIEAIDINAPSLTAKGRLAIAPDLSINHGYLEDVIWPGNRIETILLARNENAVMKITVQGEQINLIPLRRHEGLAEGRDLKFDITSEKIILGADITFNGHLEGQTSKDGNGQARLQGSLMVKDVPLLSEGTIDTLFGREGEFLTASGIIGGAEAELSYSPSDTGQSILLITSKNGGRTLDGLNVTDTIRGGQLKLATTFSEDSLSAYRTEIELTDFHVVEAPRAVWAFSVLSVAGLSSLVEGEGTHFSKGQAIIVANENKFRLEKVRAVGEAVGVHLLGNYDRKTKQVEVSGDLIPLKQFSTLIGYVPIVGELLTGVDKVGIFSTQFTMSGDVDDPDISVNLLALAPGVLRDILSPDWLGGERRRILGTQE